MSSVHLVGRCVHNGSWHEHECWIWTLYSKFLYGEISVRRNFCTAKLTTVKLPYGEISLRRSFHTANFPTAKFPTGEFPVTAHNAATRARIVLIRHRARIGLTRRRRRLCQILGPYEARSDQTPYETSSPFDLDQVPLLLYESFGLVMKNLLIFAR